MTVKEWLERGRGLDGEVEQLKYERQRALDLACETSFDMNNERVQTSKGNVTESKFIHYADYSKMLDEKIDELCDYRKQMNKLINRLDNTTYRTLLRSYYINCRVWAVVAEDINYSEKWTKELHKKALEAAEIIFSEMQGRG